MSSKAERRAAARQAADGGVAVDTAAGGPAPLPSPPRPPPASKKDVPCRKGSACEDARCAFKHPAPAPPVVAAAAAVVTPRCPVTEFPQLAPALGAARGAPHAAVAAAAAAAARGGVAARAEALLRSLLEFVEGFEPTAAGPPAAEALVGALGEQLAGAARAAAAARRPLPPPFAAAFGWLKAAALRLPRDAPLDAAKRGVRAEVEAFIAGGVRCAGELARCAAGARGGLLRAALAPGRRVAVLGRSAAVEALLVEAHARLAPGGGDSFSVLLLPGAVAGEGEAAAARLASAGVRVALCAGTAVDEALSGADALLLGAAAVLGDGSLLARAGAAAACLRAAAAEPPVPVVVAAESFKFVELLLPPGDGSAVAEVRLREGAPPAPAPAAKAPPAEPASEELLRVPWSGGGGGGDARAPRAAPHELCVFLDCVPAALVSGYVTELAPALLSPGDAALVVAAVEERWPGWGAGGGEGAGGGGGARAALSAHLQACGGAEEALVAALFAAAPMRRAAAVAPEDTCKRDAAAAAAAPGAADAAAWPAWRAAKAPLLEKFSALATRLARRQAGDSDAAVVGFFAKGLCELLAALPERGHGVTVGCALNECARLAAPVLDAAPALLALPAICARFFALLQRAKPGREVADVHLQPLSAELAKALGKLLEEELLVDFEDVAKDVKPLLLAALRPGESVLTAGSDPLVSAALEKCAAREPPLRVFWAEGGPGAPGRAAAATFLAAAPTATVVVIPDACAAAVLAAGAARRVVLPAAAVARDGSAVAPAGALPLALAARAAGAALLLLAPAYALSPATSAGRLLACGPRLQGDRPVEIFAAGAAGAAAVGACGFRALDAPRAQPVDVVNPLFDAVPAHLVSLLLTNRGGAGGSSGIARLGERAFGRAP